MKTGKFAALAGAIALASSLAACENMSRQDVGTLGGAAAGGVLGSAVTDDSTIGTVGGAIAGGYAGRELADED